MSTSDMERIIEEAVALAETWQKRANELLSPQEETFQTRLTRLLNNSMDKVVLTRMIDQSFRSKKTGRVARQISNILKRYGHPQSLSPFERLLTHLFVAVGRSLHIISVPIVIHRIRKESSRFVLSDKKRVLSSFLHKRRDTCIRMNINHLGEAVLGEEEALSRLNTYLEDLKNPEIECVSVKISTLYSQILPIAFDYSVSIIKDRLSLLYREGQRNFFIRSNGDRVPKFVNLDMEGYRDLHITAMAFTMALEEEGLLSYTAGIALQSYLPESYDIQQKLTDWAKVRVARGGNPIKIRLVKGANMEMEKVESAITNWPLAPFDNKLDVDAHFKRMVDFGIRPENIKAVHLGIGSHNLFELAYAYQLARHRKVCEYFTFEMLEGMADHVCRAIRETTEDMLIYTPVVSNEGFINAIAYLIRRLDENTGEENFLRYASDLKTDSSQWSFLKEQFIAACKHVDQTSTAPNRIQDRTLEHQEEKNGTYFEEEFINESDTDWSLYANRKWSESIRDRWKISSDARPAEIPIVVAGKEIYEERKTIECIDPSQVNVKNREKACVARWTLSEGEDAVRAVKVAKTDPDGWRNKSLASRHDALSKVANNLRRARGDLIGSTAASTGKIFSEADVEVSEAIDFTEYYPRSLEAFEGFSKERCRGKGVGVGVVISPWNFPIAIPCGGIAAALAAGNTVIFKPASSAVPPGWELCRCFWEAGISKNVLQFLPGSGAFAGAALTKHPDVDFIIFTGGTDTGLKILEQSPEVCFAGETGGKNTTIVTSMADRDLAINNILHSAFSNCGQKCSATSLLILEKEVYRDKDFKRRLVDAAKSYSVGTVWKFKNKMGPLIRPPEGKLKKALTRLEPGEQWALKPKNIHNNPYLWTPGIKWGVISGSYTHMTEFFGPVLGVMEAKDLDYAIELANQTGYGLTAGLESLDPLEQEYWQSRIRSGNLYINKSTTGAVVLRQPFGGMGKSALGAGIKAGGPNYAIQFMDIEDITLPHTGAIENDHPLLQLSQRWRQKLNWDRLKGFEPDLRKTIRAIRSYLFAKEQEFSREKDYFHLRGQDNFLRYLPIGTVAVRLHHRDSLFEILARIAAVRVSGCNLIISIPPGLKNNSTEFLLSSEGKEFLDNAEITFQSDRELIDTMPHIEGIRYAGPDRAPKEVLKAAAKTGFYISRTRVIMEGRIELLQYYQEQSICHSYHRYGNLGERAIILGARC